MFKLNFTEQSKSLGKAPGNIDSLIGENQSSSLSVYRYNASSADLELDISHDDLKKINYDDQVVWINYTGKPSREQIDFIGDFFQFESLAIEDILVNNHRPKLEDSGEYFFCILRIPVVKEEGISTQQFSIFLKNNVLISFIDIEENVFDDIKKRIFNPNSKLRSKKEDYLFYLLLDAVVDKYFYALNALNIKYEVAMEELEQNLDLDDFKNVQNLKHEILNLRRNISAIKEIINKLSKDESNIVSSDSHLNIKDLADNIYHANESAEMLREMIVSLIELGHTMLSNRMNEIMKVLTIMSTIFIPITFIAGIYGMNFTNMPELNFPYGYHVSLAVMFILVVSMLIFFKRKKWF
jgi:magnesium transporter